MKYYSEQLNKLYDTEEDLKAAEKVANEAAAKKLEDAKNKKAEAKLVEDAFKARNAARRDYNNKVMDARKAYNTALAEAKKAFNDAIAEATNDKDKAEEAYNTALKEFTDKHDSYHMTLKDGDNVVTISNSSDKQFEAMNKDFNSLIDSILNIWKI